MKKTAILLLVTVTLCYCKKGGNNNNTDLVSKWEIRKSVGGFVGTAIYQPGNGYVLEIKNDNSFAIYDKGNILRSGTYDLQATSEENHYRIIFHTNVDEAQDAVLKGDTLELQKIPECCDIPYGFTYVRVN